ncbi:MAG: hypothetical protein GWN55_07330, partial [Phycisphaerae bacterium]|nr:hypothetical protein [Phycisphaerae bacterium]NIS54156.1 hypothetical protein [Phycisphaerae bacterium]NIV01121.1 hypothetical protein [Phycisphaerae bacterium]NIW98151.1 hypothetical protein [Phycisphaerae bacterium]
MTKVYGSTDSANNAIGYITQGVGFPLIVIDDSPPPAELLIDAPDPIINPYTGTVANLNLGWNENGLTGTGLTIQYANIGNLGPNYKL